MEENKWIKVQISQTPTADYKYNFEVRVNGQRVLLEENTTPALYNKPKVYIGDPWHASLDGKIKELKVSSKRACPCPRIGSPVCGENEKEYANICLAKCEGVKKKCDGKCPCKKPRPCAEDVVPVCGENEKEYASICLA